jgi:beta-lactamase class A
MSHVKDLLQQYKPYWPVATLLIGGIIGWLLPIQSPFVQQQVVGARGGVLRESSAHYQFIDPLLACDIGTEASFPELSPLKDTLTGQVTKKINNGSAQDISVYVRLLKNAHWIAVNGQDTYAPASLLKVFVMLAYYKSANETDNPSLLQRQVKFEGSRNPAQDDTGEIIPHLVSGQYYTIDQVIRQMIVYSDNDALNTLLDNIDPSTLKYFELVFSDLNISPPSTWNEESFDFMSVDQYATVFRVLYGSTYLSERYSEQALDLLSQAHYKGGLVAGVPEGLTVAHKFGITTQATTTTTTQIHQLHDCGIVYYPNNPYLICVMTAGKDFGTLQSSIKDISAAAYQWLDGYNKSLSAK